MLKFCCPSYFGIATNIRMAFSTPSPGPGMENKVDILLKAWLWHKHKTKIRRRSLGPKHLNSVYTTLHHHQTPPQTFRTLPGQLIEQFSVCSLVLTPKFRKCKIIGSPQMYTRIVGNNHNPHQNQTPYRTIRKLSFNPTRIFMPKKQWLHLPFPYSDPQLNFLVSLSCSQSTSLKRG